MTTSTPRAHFPQSDPDATLHARFAAYGCGPQDPELFEFPLSTRPLLAHTWGTEGDARTPFVDGRLAAFTDLCEAGLVS